LVALRIQVDARTTSVPLGFCSANAASATREVEVVVREPCLMPKTFAITLSI
jgi:hypothetical protein